MDIDIPLLLTVLVLITGAGWLVDVAWFRRRRVQAAEGVDASDPDVGRLVAAPKWVELCTSLFPVFLVVLALRSFLAEPYQIPSESMLPALEVGDFVLVNKFAYGLRVPVVGTKIVDIGAPRRGDIMVFIPPHDPRYFIKRVIGLPGDAIRYQNKALYVNGERLVYAYEPDWPALPPIRAYSETVDGKTYITYRYPFREPVQEWRVPEGHYFMMGDNRGRSEDSRRWPDPFVPDDQIVGKAVAIWMHKPPGFHLPEFSRNRWFD